MPWEVRILPIACWLALISESCLRGGFLLKPKRLIGPLRVLVLDNNLDAATMWATPLSEPGHAVTTACDA